MKKTAADATMSLTERTARLDAIIEANDGYVHRANEANMSYMLRRPTGITSLDLALGGGFPAAAASVIVGPDGVGKDYLLWRTMAVSQRLYGKDFAAAVYLTEFLADKRYIRDRCGLKIGLSDAEIDEINVELERRDRPRLTDEQAWHYQETEGTVITITGATAETGFDRILDFVKSNTCQIVAVNSIGFLFTEVKEAMESLAENPQQRNEAVALTKFTTHLATHLNRGGPDGERIETAVLLINQMRSKDPPRIPGRVPSARDKMKPAAEAWALKHAKAIELALYPVEGKVGRLYGPDDPNKLIGRKKAWEITKGKLGLHEGAKGEFDYYFTTGADIAGDLYDAAVSVGLIEAEGAWASLVVNGEVIMRVNGRNAFRARLTEDPELVDFIRDACCRKAPTVFRTR